MENNLQHQDWKTVYMHLDNKKSKKKGDSSNKNIKSKKGKSNNLDEVDRDTFKIKKVNANFSKEMCQRRNALGITQKDLAQKINVRPNIINDYESGKAIPNSAILNKIKRQLKM